MAKKKSGYKPATESALRRKYAGTGLAEDVLSDNNLWIPSRFLALNDQFGGGAHYGKIHEIFGEESSGKSLSALDFAYCTQKLGGVVLWADSEYAFTKDWARQNGINLSKVELFQEKAIEVISDWSVDMGMHYRSQLVNNEPILLVVDSIAALSCLANLNGYQQDEKAEMGNRAKAIDGWLRTRNGIYEKLGVTVLLINQLRAKIGASLFEDPDCSNFETIVPLTDGRSFKIGEIVENKIKGNVWSFDETTKTFIEKPITGWIKKEPLKVDEKWVSIKTQGPGTKNGSMFGIFTEDHAIYTRSGWVNVKNLRGDDKLITHYENKINGELEQFLLGTFIGDCSLHYREGKREHTTNMSFQDNENPDYLNWKLSKIPFEFKKKPTARIGKFKYRSDYSIELALYQQKLKYRDPLKAFEMVGMNPLTLSTWYMDDGHISKGRHQMSISISFDRTDIEELVKYLNDNKLYCYKGYGSKKRKARKIVFTAQGARNLSKYIREYVPDMMQYKLLPEDRGYYKEFTPSYTIKQLPLEIDIISIEPAKDKYYKNLNKYDLSIEGTKNFLAGNTTNGFIVHNTTPGGRATRFYASIRVGFYGGKQITSKVNGVEERVGRVTSIRIKKNKVAPPKPTIKGAEVFFHPDYKEPVGFNKYFGLPELLQQHGVISRKKGSSKYMMGDEVIANGELAFLKKLKNDAEFRKMLIDQTDINTISKTKAQLKGINENLYPVNFTKADIQDESEEE